MTRALCVVHLVRAANGLTPFTTFLDSYRACPAGVEHDLLLVFKGFTDASSAGPYEAAAADVAHRSLHLSDAGFDVDAYGEAASEIGHEFVCFVNSFSRILDAGWLEKLHARAAMPGIGAVGATGSWESLRTNALGDGPASRSAAALALSATSSLLRRGRPSGVRALVSRRAWQLRRHFPPFPNPHLRTNAFLLRRDLWLRVRPPALRWKSEAERFESGQHGLTRRVAAAGLRSVVVGRDGAATAPDQWPLSRTFRVGEQENLLVADNRTEGYRLADTPTRSLLRRMAWGDGPWT